MLSDHDFAEQFIAARTAARRATSLQQLDAAHRDAEAIRRAARAAGIELAADRLDVEARRRLRAAGERERVT